MLDTLGQMDEEGVCDGNSSLDALGQMDEEGVCDGNSSLAIAVTDTFFIHLT
jgi:hypothetical protein